MAVSKRLRFEIFRRDNHTCRYCGAAGKGVTLVVDHVTPEALGGNDQPDNLVTACEPCNAGKSSMAPDQPVVADVRQDAFRWSRAMQAAVDVRAEQQVEEDYRVYEFQTAWAAWRFGFNGRYTAPLPDRFDASVTKFLAAGLTSEFLQWAMAKTMKNEQISLGEKWRYFCGICWRELDAIREIAMSLLAVEEVDG